MAQTLKLDRELGFGEEGGGVEGLGEDGREPIGVAWEKNIRVCKFVLVLSFGNGKCNIRDEWKI